ncbi:hypothetical protein [Flavobacterium sp. GSA192]|uniref:hypothetical protein n=1 Tax=Flavobacterium sp. GSA192 TaxID=2576304 RepID=UPI00112A8564|nr:hypothetical protein [Flavobacterium sp. GSA192]
MVKNSLLIVILLLVVSSCNKSFDTVEDAYSYIQNEDNGYTKTKKINGIDINLTYKPSELIAGQEFSNNNYSEAKKDSLKKEYNKYLYFVLSLSKNNKEILSSFPQSREQLNSIQNTLTFEMNQRASLVNSNRDTIPLIDFNSPRTYGMSKSTSVLFVFERNKLVEDSDEFYFNLQDIGLETGDLKFKFDKTIKKQLHINF